VSASSSVSGRPDPIPSNSEATEAHSRNLCERVKLGYQAAPEPHSEGTLMANRGDIDGNLESIPVRAAIQS